MARFAGPERMNEKYRILCYSLHVVCFTCVAGGYGLITYGYRFLPLIGLPLSFYFAALVVGLIFEEGSPTADPDGLKT